MTVAAGKATCGCVLKEMAAGGGGNYFSHAVAGLAWSRLAGYACRVAARMRRLSVDFRDVVPDYHEGIRRSFQS